MNKSLVWRFVLIGAVIAATLYAALPLDKKIKLGLDLKGGVEFTPYAARLSALATTRTECAELLADLLAEVNAARFRQDLYYRLRVVEIRVPALRERRDAILPLARTFLALPSARTGRKATGLPPNTRGMSAAGRATEPSCGMLSRRALS